MMRFSFAIALTVLGSPAYAAPSVSISDGATVSAAVIRLGDVADLQGVPTEFRVQLSRIVLGHSPVAGSVKYVPRTYIERRIKDALGRFVSVKGPERLAVKRLSAILKGDMLRQRVRAAVESRLTIPLEDVAEIKIPRLSDLRVPAGATARVQLADHEDFQGAVTAEIIIEDGAKRVRTRRVSIRVDTFASVIGVRRELRRGHRITRADLIAMRLPKSRLADDVVTRPEFVEGAEIRRRIRIGEPLRQSWIKIPPVIDRGARVRLIARRGAVVVTATGEALNNAALGAYVRVRNSATRKIVSGRAMEPGVVELEF